MPVATEPTQKQRILAWLVEGNTLTKLQAILWWGIMNLGGRIGELRDDGFKIETKMKHTGEGKEYAVYSMPRGQGRLW